MEEGEEHAEKLIEASEPKKYEVKIKNKNPWIFVSGILAVVVIVILVFNPFGGIITGNVISGRVIGGVDVGEQALDFFNTQLSQVPGTLEDIEKESGIYKISINRGGQILPVYFTVDGKFIAQGQELVPMTGQAIDTSSQTQQTVEEYSEEDIEKIKTFVTCLSEKDFKIYGANWCGWTKKLVVDTFGGFDIVEPIYVECTEEEEICSQEEVTGYPTIKLSGELYQGARTFEGISEATDCEAPDVGTVVTSSNGEASCN